MATNIVEVKFHFPKCFGHFVRNFRRQHRSPPLLILAAILCCCICCCQAEEIFHRRDHSDQGEYSDNQVIYTVQTYEDALTYLHKYGYLNCSLQRSKRDLVAQEDESHSTSNLASLDDLAQEGQVIKPSCTDNEIKDAFRTMQSKFGLTTTGEFNAETQKTMSSSRCGNSDTESSPNSPNALQPSRPGSMANKPGRVRRRALDMLHSELPSSAAATDSRRYVARVDLPRLREVKIDRETTRKRREAMYHELKQKYSEDVINKPNVMQRQSRRSKRFAKGRSRSSRPSFKERVKRTIGQFTPDEVTEEGGSPTKFDQQEVCWRLLETGLSHRIPAEDQTIFLELAFRRFGEVCPIKFKQCIDLPYGDVDILIAFGREDHQNCNKPFDGNGGELAHSWVGGNIHFDDSENYKSLQESKRTEESPSDINLLKVAVHEIGHVLGLIHVNNETSIMFPIYQNREDEFEINREDRRAVQQLYGVCKGRFDVVMDWVRKKYSPGNFIPAYKYNSFFFRGDSYWLYENPENRPRYGDPLEVVSHWTGVPPYLDGYTQIFTDGLFEYEITTLFFKGDYYYKYDDARDRVHPEYPRKISMDFGPKPGYNESIPNNIDSVLFDPRDSLLYFFKGEWVWAYDPKKIGQNGCCENKYRFEELYPVKSGEPLKGNVDAVYRSFFHRTVFIFVNEQVYRNEKFGSARDNLLVKQGPWFDTWYDICDPRPQT